MEFFWVLFLCNGGTKMPTKVVSSPSHPWQAVRGGGEAINNGSAAKNFTTLLPKDQPCWGVLYTNPGCIENNHWNVQTIYNIKLCIEIYSEWKEFTVLLRTSIDQFFNSTRVMSGHLARGLGPYWKIVSSKFNIFIISSSWSTLNPSGLWIKCLYRLISNFNREMPNIATTQRPASIIRIF